MLIVRMFFVAIAFFGSVAVEAALSIDGYRYVIVVNPTDDSRGVHSRISTEIEKSGMKTVSSPDSLSPEDRLLTCRIEVSQYGGLTQYCHISARDFVSDKLIIETTESCRARIGIAACITGSIQNAWKAVKYGGFSEDAHRRNSVGLIETRPRIDLASLGPNEVGGDKILGEWLEPDSGDRLIVIRALSGDRSAFAAAIVTTRSNLWQKGEIKADIQVATSGKTYGLEWYDSYKHRFGTVMKMDDNGEMLSFDIQKDGGATKHYGWLRVAPDQQTFSASEK